MGACSDIWDLWRNYWPVLAGNALEWYEFAVYGAWDIVIIVGRSLRYSWLKENRTSYKTVILLI